MPTFVIFALPRSRTVWLSRFLSYGGWHCGHDETLHVRSLEDVQSWLSQPFTGTAETNAAPFWRTLTELQPDARVVVVRRPVEEVVESFRRTGIDYDFAKLRAHLEHLDRKLDQIEKRMDVLSVRYADLETEETCAKVFEHCLPFKHDHVWWEALSTKNIQRSLLAQIRYYASHQAQCDRAAAQMKVRTLCQFAHRPTVELAELSIQHEPFETFYAAAKPLFRDHLRAVGEHPEAFGEKNLELFRALDSSGALQCTTARCNGRMFGYLMTVIGPSLESSGRTVAMPTVFYASPDFPGLGRKLQLAAKDGMVERGVDELQFRAGTRADGPRLASLYKRMGAEDHGHLFRLKLKDF